MISVDNQSHKSDVNRQKANFFEHFKKESDCQNTLVVLNDFFNQGFDNKINQRVMLSFSGTFWILLLRPFVNSI